MAIYKHPSQYLLKIFEELWNSAFNLLPIRHGKISLNCLNISSHLLLPFLILHATKHLMCGKGVSSLIHRQSQSSCELQKVFWGPGWVQQGCQEHWCLQGVTSLCPGPMFMITPIIPRASHRNSLSPICQGLSGIFWRSCRMRNASVPEVIQELCEPAYGMYTWHWNINEPPLFFSHFETVGLLHRKYLAWSAGQCFVPCSVQSVCSYLTVTCSAKGLHFPFSLICLSKSEERFHLIFSWSSTNLHSLVIHNPQHFRSFHSFKTLTSVLPLSSGMDRPSPIEDISERRSLMLQKTR